jgi:hypothetical protein
MVRCSEAEEVERLLVKTLLCCVVEEKAGRSKVDVRNVKSITVLSLMTRIDSREGRGGFKGRWGSAGAKEDEGRLVLVMNT